MVSSKLDQPNTLLLRKLQKAVEF